MSIKLLSQDVINRLAAGEIIHSEVQAIKELIENSVDAGASKVEITIVDQNTFIYRDNGSGISKEDLPLLCVRFATSKLDKYEHLQSVQTLGFRGEALSSISYVAEVLVETTHNGVRSRASYKDSDMLWVQSNDAAEQNFTKFEIKFNSLEINYLSLQRFVQVFQLLNNNVEFIIQSQEQTLQLTAGTREKLIQQYFNIQGDSEQLHRIQLKKPKFDLNMYISLPNNKYTLIKQQIFINNRYIKDTSLYNTINTLLRTYLMNKKFNYTIFLTVDPNDLDFNCHVQKLKVLFKNYETVINNIVEAMQKFKRDNQNIIELNQKSATQSTKTAKPNKTQNPQQVLCQQITISTLPGIKLQQYTNQKSNLQYLRMTQLNQQIDYQIQQSQTLQKSINNETKPCYGIKLYLQYVIQTKLLSKETLLTLFKQLYLYYRQIYIEYPIKNLKILNLATSKILKYIFIQIELNLVQIELNKLVQIIIEHAILKNYISMQSPFIFFDILDRNDQYTDQEVFLGFSQQTSLTFRDVLLQFGIKHSNNQNDWRNANSDQLTIVETLQTAIRQQILDIQSQIMNKQQLINQLNNYLLSNCEIITVVLENSNIISQNQILTMFDRQ